MRRFIALALVLSALSGCGKPKIDGTSEQAFKQSVPKVAESLPKDKREKFESDAMLLAFQGVDISSVLKGNISAGQVAGDMFMALDGMTADDVSAKADRIRLERAEREKQQAIAEMAELSSRAELAQAAKAELSKFQVQKSRFYKEKPDYGYTYKPVIEMTVVNGTTQAVGRAYFKGTISSPGRTIPWLVKEFNYEVSGGVEPGESQDWNLAPNQFSEWGKVEPPKDALFTVEVVRLDGANGEPIGGPQFTDQDAERLAKLKEKFPN